MRWLWLVMVAGCAPDEGVAPTKVLDGISPAAMKETIDYMADDASQGRVLNSAGHDQVRDYLIGVLEDLSLQPLGLEGGYIHPFPHAARFGVFQPTADGGAEPSQDGTGNNLVAVLPGSDPQVADEYLVLVAHYDHLGVNADGTDVFNGAFDDAGGVAMILELTRAIIEADRPLRRSLLLLVSDSEEISLQGAEGWIDDPTVDLDDVVAALSIDPVGRPYLSDYWPVALIGAERTPDLLDLLYEAAPLYTSDEARRPEVRFMARDMIEIFASDQDAFLEAGIPAVWFISPGMSFYHQLGDEPDTIDYRTMVAQGRWLAHVVYALDAHEGGFELQEPPPWDTFLLREMDSFWAGVLSSEELDENEREAVQAARDELAPAIAAGDASLLEDLETLKLAQLALLFQITQEHPGPIPPPFPEE